MLSLFQSCRCQRPLQISFSKHYAARKSHNNAIVGMLLKQKEDEESSPNRNPYKVRAFDTAIKYVNKLDHPLRSAGEAITMKGIGPGIARRISEFLVENDDLADTSDATKEMRQDALRKILTVELKSIPGIGSVMAKRLIDAGVKTFADLQKEKYLEMLSQAQKVAVRYLHHLDKPLSREQAETVAEFIRANISKRYQVILVGSYRRRAATLSDIDIILLHPNHVHVPVPNIPPSQPLPKPRVLKRAIRAAYITDAEMESSPLHGVVVPILEQRGLLAGCLRTGSGKWQGIVRIPEKDEQGRWDTSCKRLEEIAQGTGIFGRLNLNLVPIKSRGPAMISLTGDTELNRHLRFKAIKLGLHLNEFGLWRWISNGTPDIEETDVGADAEEGMEGASEVKEPGGYWQLLRATTEEEIFEQLGLDFIEPHRRNFAFMNKRSVPVQETPMRPTSS